MMATDVATRLGLRKHSRDWRGKCPACGYQAFSIRSGRNGVALWSCWGCQDRDSITTALHRVFGGNWTTPTPTPRAQESADRQAKDRVNRALRVWEQAISPGGTPVSRYLGGRALSDLVGSPVIRFAPSTSHPQGGPGLPAMVARVQSVSGETIGVHRTYLRPNGSGKADVEPAKASLGIVWGGAIRLHPHDPRLPLIIGEGIESAASAAALSGYPAWSAISAGNLGGGLELPPEVGHVVIAADPDQVGEQRAVEAAWRWQREGRKVEIARTKCEADWNEILVRSENRRG